MPHSVSREESSTPHQAMDAKVENGNGETPTTEGTAVADTNVQNRDSQETVGQEMTMADVGIEEQDILAISVKEEVKLEVKLEDLFADMESDEEFPSSAGIDVKVSSSPDAPASPLYVLDLAFDAMLTSQDTLVLRREHQIPKS